MVMLVAKTVYFYGVQASNMTTMAYTMLAYLIIRLVLELVLRRVNLSPLGVRDLAGFVLLVAGYLVIVSKPQPLEVDVVSTIFAFGGDSAIATAYARSVLWQGLKLWSL